jgi:hypothetical protein
MMCLACEQDALWFAYLQRRGLITPDGYLVEQPPSLIDPIEPAATQDEKKTQAVTDPAQKDLFSCDDPSNG